MEINIDMFLPSNHPTPTPAITGSRLLIYIAVSDLADPDLASELEIVEYLERALEFRQEGDILNASWHARFAPPSASNPQLLYGLSPPQPSTARSSPSP